MIKRIQLIVILSVIALGLVFRGSIAYLLILILFLGIITYNLIDNIIKYIRTRKGVFSSGRILSLRKLNADEIKNANWEIEIEFSNPLNENVYSKKFYLFFFQMPDASKTFRVWINTKDISKSIIVEQFNLTWMLLIILGLGIWVYLFIFLLKELLVLLPR